MRDGILARRGHDIGEKFANCDRRETVARRLGLPAWDSRRYGLEVFAVDGVISLGSLVPASDGRKLVWPTSISACATY